MPCGCSKASDKVDLNVILSARPKAVQAKLTTMSIIIRVEDPCASLGGSAGVDWLGWVGKGVGRGQEFCDWNLIF